MKKQLLYAVLVLFIAVLSGNAHTINGGIPKNTYYTCGTPYNVTVSEVTMTSVKLNWVKAVSTDNSWEILMVPASTFEIPATDPLENPVLENGTVMYTVTGNVASKVVTDLDSGAIFVCYVRTVCAAGEKSSWTAAVIVNTLLCPLAEQCVYRFYLTNITNNNWNFGRMQVRQNGLVVKILGTGGVNNPNGITVSLCTDLPFDLYWSAAGDMPQEIGVKIVSPFNDVIFNKLPGEGTPLTVLYADSTLGNCTPPTCPKPTDLLVNNISQTSAQLSWTEVGSATQWEVYLAEDGAAEPVNGAPLNTENASYFITNTNTNFLISELAPSTKYIYYVRAICSVTDYSTWTILNPKTFITIPVNDDCAAAINIPVNPTPEIVQYIAGNTLGGTASSQLSTCPGNENDDVWFSFVPTNAIQVVKLKNIIGSTTNLRFAVYAGSDCGTMTQLFCNSSNIYDAPLQNLQVGQVYKVRVYTNGSNPNQSATFDISVTTPPPPGSNDESINAIQLTVNNLSECVYTTPGNLIGATASIGFPSDCTGNEDDDIWFSFVATSDRHIINLLNIEGTTTNLNHSVFSGTYDNLTQFYCAPSNSSSSTASNFIPGITYYVRVWSNISNSQVVTFNICVKPISTCITAAPFCGGSFGDPYIFPNTIGIASSSSIACLFSSPNPTYYTLNVSQTGPINFTIYQNTYISPSGELLGTNLDVDFVAWGPFATPESCEQILFEQCPTCPNNTTNPNFYPLGNIVDCSYDTSATETLSIPNAQAGEYYLILLTNWTGQPGYISLLQDNYDEPGAGATSCGDSIQLVAFVDANNNGIKEETESKFTYGSFTFQKNNTGTTYYVTNPMGVQNIYDANTANTYDFNYEINSEYAAYYTETPTSFNDLSIPFGSGVQTLYFPITVAQTYTDIDVSIVSMGMPRPGFNYTQKVVYRNLGTMPISGTVTFAKGNANISITEIFPAPTAVLPAGFSYDFVNLAPGEVGVIDVKMSVPSIPSVNLGDVASNSVAISSVENDINLNNNNFAISQIVVGSYDPNDKIEARGATVTINQFDQEDYLFYTIRFQNTGTASAETVRIEDNLTSDFDFASVRMISASHHYSMERINNKLVWTFNNINLLGAFENETLSQGYVTFKIKLNPGFTVDDVIENTAEIYFDFNPAIVTNTFQTIFVTNLSVKNFEVNNVVIYPNPAKEVVQIMLQNSTETMSKIVIYDIIGKAIKAISGTNSQQATMNVSDLASGVYMIEIITDSNLKQIRKFIVN